MKSEFDETAYQLVWDIDHFKELDLDWNEDILFQKYDGYVSWKYRKTETFTHPTPLIYEGTLDIVRHIDYPYPDNMWTIMSERMLKTLLSVGDFPHRAIPSPLQIRPFIRVTGMTRRGICEAINV